ncbi:hypothetical protein G7068_01645 [Leucobacter viscericola]|uniref:HTH luxR-type domain-containing protein n=1 Tax=Leucobacter viscericola TaxID=2714935 RepID=A0A6G7XC21_9MICO|nr:LuxR C-terminal-related transcriptional regulator [Leucobacter viscericola]QIK62052.1 hypothetical protein G7068_01645 [Leucobacter viscericola]
MEKHTVFEGRHPGVFALPQRPRIVIERGRLAETALPNERNSPVAMWAPTGTGKTTLLSLWAQLANDAGRGLVCINLAELPRNSPPLESLVNHAAHRVEPGIEQTRMPRGWSVYDIRHPLTLIIDDVHLLNNRRDLEWLMALAAAGLPELQLRVAGRYSPFMPTIEGEQFEAIELRESDLAFTVQETAQYLERVGVHLAPAEHTLVAERAAGWAIAISLFAHLVRLVPDRESFLDEFDRDEHALGDFLVYHLLELLPEDTAAFLLATSVAQQLTVPFAVRLSGRQDAGEILHRLLYLNLVREQHSGQQQVYSYHPLLRTYLGMYLRTHDHAAALSAHAVAQEWYITHDQPVLAVEEALKTERPSAVRELLDTEGFGLVCSGDSFVVNRAIQFLHESRSESATTHILSAVLALPFDPCSTTARLHLDRAQVTLDRAPLPMQVVHAALRVIAARPNESPDAELAKLTEVLALYSSERLSARTDERVIVDTVMFADVARGWAARLGGSWQTGSDALQEAAARAEDADRPWLALLAHSLHAKCELEMGHWYELSAVQDRISSILPSSSVAAPAAVRSEITLNSNTGDTALVRSERLNWAVTRYLRCESLSLSQVEDLRSRGGTGEGFQVDTPAEFLRALLSLEAEANQREAFDELDELIRTSGRAVPRSLALASYRYIDRCLHLRGLAEAKDALGIIVDALGPDSLEAQVVTTKLSEGNSRQRELETELEHRLTHDRHSRALGTSIYGWLLLASWADSSGRSSLADARITRALGESRPLRCRLPFIANEGQGAKLLADRAGRFGAVEPYVDSILVLHEQRHGATGLGGGIGVLTHKEHEVLRELPKHQSISMIASNQQLSPNTIKSHLRSIYQKLGVTGRAEAVAAASSHGLL